MTPTHRLPAALCLLALAIPASASAFDFFGLGKSTEPPKPGLRPASYTNASTPERVDRIVVKKTERRLYLMHGDEIVRSYKVALGYQPKGHKQRQGDGRTPEGRYLIDAKNGGSRFRKALHISYPSITDRLRAANRGKDPGGSIMIHGQPNGRTFKKDGDWTFGCIAVSNMEIDEIHNDVDVGTPIEILP